jgi:hypothetical protein
MNEVYATTAVEALAHADNAIGVTVREICAHGAGTPRQRAELAADVLHSHYTSQRTTRLIEAAEAEEARHGRRTSA